MMSGRGSFAVRADNASEMLLPTHGLSVVPNSNAGLNESTAVEVPLPRVFFGDEGLGVQLRLDGMELAMATPAQPDPAWLVAVRNEWCQRTDRRGSMAWDYLSKECELVVSAYLPADRNLAALLRPNRETLADLVRAGGFTSPDQCRRALLALLRFMEHHRLNQLGATDLTGDGIVASLQQVSHSRGGAGAMLVALERIAGMANPSFPPRLPTIGTGQPTLPCPPSEASAILTGLAALPNGLRRISALTIFHGGRGAGLNTPDLRFLRGNWVTTVDDAVVIDIADGPHPRLVVVASDHARPLQELADAVGDGYLVAPNRDGLGGKNLVANVLGWVNGQLGDGLVLDPIAQRHAFIQAHLAAGTPLPVLRYMCGGISARTIAALLPDNDVTFTSDELLTCGRLTAGSL